MDTFIISDDFSIAFTASCGPFQVFDMFQKLATVEHSFLGRKAMEAEQTDYEKRHIQVDCTCEGRAKITLPLPATPIYTRR